MARRYYQQPVYRTPGPQPHPLLNAIVGCMVTIAILMVIAATCGPVVDYFALYVGTVPAGANETQYAAYANAVLPMYQWVYLFIIAVGIISIAGVWIAVARSLTYSRYGD